MRAPWMLSLAASGLLASSSTSRADEPAQAPAEKPAVAPKPANADAPLPEGFPDGTAPGKIEIKNYPAYRSAMAKGEGMSSRSGDMMFWWLFQHITKNDVEMTAPVINTYLTPGMATDPNAKGELTMEFLYERPDQGQPGKGTGPVEVVDHPAMTVVALGFQGAMGPRQMAEGVETLEKWLEEHKAEWVAAGPPRRLGYHGPMTPVAQRLWEVQIPVKPAAEAEKPPVEKVEPVSPH